MTNRVAIHIALVTILGSALVCRPAPASAQTPAPRPSVFQTTLEEPNQLTPEITTAELQAILAAGIVPVFDVRTAEEFAIAHIPGTINIYEKEIDNIRGLYPLVDPTNPPPMILYCNGPSCGKSKRTSEELFKLGYTNVKRYQLGLPVWRALSLTVQTDLPGLLYIFTRDHTSVFVDARTPAEFASGTIPGAVNVQAGEAVAANDDGRLPFRDKSTRVVVFGNTAQQAKVVGGEIAKRAYWGSSYFGGTLDDLLAAGLINHPPTVLAKDAVVGAGQACTAVIGAAVVDNGSFDSDGDSLALSVSPSGSVGLGSHAIVLSGTDGRGASSTATATVNVTDGSAPTIGPVDTNSGRPQRNGWVPVTLDYAVTDNCSAATTAVTVGSWRGTHGDAQVIDSHHLLLRAGMLYRITITARDAASNQSTVTKVIHVPSHGR
jgi:rhodanese-related sulfurtransferase